MHRTDLAQFFTRWRLLKKVTIFKNYQYSDEKRSNYLLYILLSVWYVKYLKCYICIFSCILRLFAAGKRACEGDLLCFPTKLFIHAFCNQKCTFYWEKGQTEEEIGGATDLANIGAHSFICDCDVVKVFIALDYRRLIWHLYLSDRFTKAEIILFTSFSHLQSISAPNPPTPSEPRTI